MTTVAYDHQRRALAAVRARPHRPSDSDVFAYLCDMGTGKTKMVIDEWVSRDDLDSLLVIAPAGSYRNWFEDRAEDQPSELRRHLPAEIYAATAIASWTSGKANKDLARVLVPGGLRVLVMNVEALSTVQRARDVCERFLMTGRAMMVVDESTKIKSYRARRTRAVTALGRLAAARRIMSGLVAPRSPLDLYSQFAFLDWRIIGQPSYWTYTARYAVTKRTLLGGRSVNVVVGYRNVEDLRRKIAPYSFRVRKDECLDLPAKIFQRRDVAMTDEQKRVYSEVRDRAHSVLASGDHVSAADVLSRMLRLHQVAIGYVRDENEKLHEVPTNRLDALSEVLEDHAGKAVIWACYRHSIEAISKRLASDYGDDAVAAYWGGNATTRADDELRFLTDPDCRFMVSTPAAGGIGNNWTVADLVVYFANSWNLEHRLQSEDRCHRVGQTRSVTYVDLVCPGTVDEIIIKALRSKIDLSTKIAGDSYKEWLI